MKIHKVLVIAASIIGCSVGFASVSFGASPFDSVVGGGTNGNVLTNAHFSINAKSGPTGDDARGKFEFHITEQQPGPTTRFAADVRCLRVNGNKATTVGQITSARPESLVGRFVIVRAVDNGPPVKGDSQDDIFNSVQPANAPEPPCPDPLDVAPRGLGNGNIHITDAE